MRKNATAALLIAIVSAVFYLAGWAEPFDNRLREYRFSYDNHLPSGEIVIVDIDAKSLEKIGVWPWKRSVYAKLLDRLNALGASEVAFDIDFSNASFPKEDAIFAAALERAGGATILAVFNQMPTAHSNISDLHSNQPISLFADHAWPATVNVFAEPDGHIHSFPFGGMISGEPVQSIAAILSGYPGSTQGSFIIDFGLDAGSIQRFSIADILAGEISAQQLKAKKVIIGASATELRDFFTVPRNGIIPGHLLQAIAAETLLQGRAITLSGARVVLPVILALGLMFLLIMSWQKWRISLGVFAISAVLLESAATWFQVTGAYSIQTATPLFTIGAFSMFTVVREIDLRKILALISENKAQNTRTILDRVVADNFEGLVIVQEDGSIYALSRAAARMLQENNENIPVDLIGHPFCEIAPLPFADAVSAAFKDIKSGTWVHEPPQILDGAFGASDRKILEFGVMPSKLEGAVTINGQKEPDSIVACLSFRDITKRRIAEEEISYLARFDTTTGLPNRNHFIDYISSLLLETPADDNHLAIICLSLDRFKNIQDSLGYEYAEEVLKYAAKRVQKRLSRSDFLASYGESGFLLLINSKPDQPAVQALVETLLNDLTIPYHHGGRGSVVGTSAGVMMITDKREQADKLIKNADAALHRATLSTGNSFSFFEPAMETSILARQTLELDLWKAIERNQFQVYYQPQLRLSDNTLIGAEALIRWQHPERGFISPVEFIPIAEQSNLIVEIGDWVLEQACRDAATWPNHLKVAVNVSPTQFMLGNLKQSVQTALRNSGISTRQLDLEITESLFIEDNNKILKIMNELQEIGIRFALDDFGTGYSSLGYIQKFPLDKIKIDQSFVRDIDHNQQSLTIVRSVTTLSESLGIDTVAEGVETEEHLALLRLVGCTIGQGYLFAKPMPADKMLEYIQHYDDSNQIHREAMNANSA